ncbi:MAG: helix-turn-helix domain-containing protein [Rhodococcus sp. (in: high G+C Gram-positive bacteria)]
MADYAEAICEPTPFDHWQHAISEAFVPLEVRSTAPDGTDPFSGTLRSTSLGAMQLSEVAGRQVAVRRTPATITRSDPGMIKVGVQLAGDGTLVQHDREAHLTPGDFAIYDTSTPYELRFTQHFSMFVLMFPRDLLRFTSQDLDAVSARRIHGSAGIGALVSTLLTNLNAPDIDTMSASRVLQDAVLDLLIAALHAEVPPFATQEPALLSDAMSFIEANIDDTALDTAVVASRHHVSARHLQRTFAAAGHTVAGWIRNSRLEKCRHDLADVHLNGESIAAICSRYGLVNSSHFSKLFKETYGMSPRAYREQKTLSAIG